MRNTKPPAASPKPLKSARDPEHAGDHDDRQPDDDLATGPPSQQRIGEQHHVDHRVQPDGCGRTIDQRDEVQHDDRAEDNGDDSEWVRPPPEKREHQRHGEHERYRTPRDVGTKDAFEYGGQQQDSDQCPVPPDPRRGRSGSWLVSQRPDHAADHDPSLGICRRCASAERTRRAPFRRTGRPAPCGRCAVRVASPR